MQTRRQFMARAFVVALASVSGDVATKGDVDRIGEAMSWLGEDADTQTGDGGLGIAHQTLFDPVTGVTFVRIFVFSEDGTVINTSHYAGFEPYTPRGLITYPPRAHDQV